MKWTLSKGLYGIGIAFLTAEMIKSPDSATVMGGLAIVAIFLFGSLGWREKE